MSLKTLTVEASLELFIGGAYTIYLKPFFWVGIMNQIFEEVTFYFVYFLFILAFLGHLSKKEWIFDMQNAFKKSLFLKFTSKFTNTSNL